MFFWVLFQKLIRRGELLWTTRWERAHQMRSVVRAASIFAINTRHEVRCLGYLIAATTNHEFPDLNDLRLILVLDQGWEKIYNNCISKLIFATLVIRIAYTSLILFYHFGEMHISYFEFPIWFIVHSILFHLVGVWVTRIICVPFCTWFEINLNKLKLNRSPAKIAKLNTSNLLNNYRFIRNHVGNN